MMKVFVAIDSFKGAVGSAATCRAAADALREFAASPESLSARGGVAADIREFPVSDGGEGFCECIHHYLGGTWIPLPVTGPEGRTVEAKYLIVNGTSASSSTSDADSASRASSTSDTSSTPDADSTSDASSASPKTAFIESASACGYTLVSTNRPDPQDHNTSDANRPDPRDHNTSDANRLDPRELDTNRPDPRTLTTAGVGELIADAFRRGCTRIVLGLGGTATMDAGLGLYNALRKAFPASPDPGLCDSNSDSNSNSNSNSNSISDSNSNSNSDSNSKGTSLDNIEFIACVDTFAPLTGPAGAAYMYGPQKGLRKDQLTEADAWLSRQATLLGLSPASASTTASHCTSAPLASTTSAFATPTRFTTSTPGFGAAGGLLCGLTAFLSLRQMSEGSSPNTCSLRQMSEGSNPNTCSLRTMSEGSSPNTCSLRTIAEGTGTTLKIISGAEYLIEISGLKTALTDSLTHPAFEEDNILIITGEGRVDEQSLTGKLTGRIASLASSLVPLASSQASSQASIQASDPTTDTFHSHAKVICLAGSIGKGFDQKNSIFDEVLIITPEGTPLDEALAGTATNIRRTLLDYCHKHLL